MALSEEKTFKLEREKYWQINFTSVFLLYFKWR